MPSVVSNLAVASGPQTTNQCNDDGMVRHVLQMRFSVEPPYGTVSVCKWGADCRKTRTRNPTALPPRPSTPHARCPVHDVYRHGRMVLCANPGSPCYIERRASGSPRFTHGAHPVRSRLRAGRAAITQAADGGRPSCPLPQGTHTGGRSRCAQHPSPLTTRSWVAAAVFFCPRYRAFFVLESSLRNPTSEEETTLFVCKKRHVARLVG